MDARAAANSAAWRGTVGTGCTGPGAPALAAGKAGSGESGVASWGTGRGRAERGGERGGWGGGVGGWRRLAGQGVASALKLICTTDAE